MYAKEANLVEAFFLYTNTLTAFCFKELYILASLFFVPLYMPETHSTSVQSKREQNVNLLITRSQGKQPISTPMLSCHVQPLKKRKVDGERIAEGKEHTTR